MSSNSSKTSLIGLGAGASAAQRSLDDLTFKTKAAPSSRENSIPFFVFLDPDNPQLPSADARKPSINFFTGLLEQPGSPFAQYGYRWPGDPPLSTAGNSPARDKLPGRRPSSPGPFFHFPESGASDNNADPELFGTADLFGNTAVFKPSKVCSTKPGIQVGMTAARPPPADLGSGAGGNGGTRTGDVPDGRKGLRDGSGRDYGPWTVLCCFRCMTLAEMWVVCLEACCP